MVNDSWKLLFRLPKRKSVIHGVKDIAFNFPKYSTFSSSSLDVDVAFTAKLYYTLKIHLSNAKSDSIFNYYI